MKTLLLALISILITTGVFAQAPEKMSYQAIVRDASDNVIIDTEIGMQISILEGFVPDGPSVYVETQIPMTNINGLVSIEIGDGDWVSGDFATIDWANGPYFIKTEIDPTGGSTYTITGISQLLSVPYALHAKTAVSIEGGITETDPEFTSWDKTTGITITESQITDLAHTTDTDTHIDSAGIAALGFVAGAETDPSVPSGTQVGEMQFWDGSSWVAIPAGSSGQSLVFVNEKPTWGVPGMVDGDVHNPVTGRVWMDRNLGATQVATSSTDADAYGDLYQWGRAADGHESIMSAIASEVSGSDVVGHGDFITFSISPNDWRSPQNDNLWQGVDGINNPCPSGYRLPTGAEWDEERQSWSSIDSAGAFSSQLKLPASGTRRYNTGALANVDVFGYYWSSTVDGTSSKYLFVTSSNADLHPNNRAYGYSVRCIKD